MGCSIFQINTRLGVLITGAAHQEEGCDAGVILFDLFLRIASIITVDGICFFYNGCIVAGIAKEHGNYFTISIGDLNYGHIAIGRPVRMNGAAPVDGKASFSMAAIEGGFGHMIHSIINNRNEVLVNCCV